MSALVTGGGSGIGRALAEALARQMPVGIAGRRPEPLAETVARVQGGVDGAGRRAYAVAADLGDRESCRALVREVTAELGPIEVLINNAGDGGAVRRLSAGDADAWQRTLTTNVLAPAWLCAEVVPGMVERGSGTVLNVNSMQGSRAFPGCTAYGASKAALMRLTEGLAEEVAGTGVLVADVSPGLVRTDMTAEPDLAALLAVVPPEEWTPVDKVVDLVLALVSRGDDAVRQAVHGRFVHAEDDLDDLVARLAGADDDGRRLRMTPLRPDPLLD